MHLMPHLLYKDPDVVNEGGLHSMHQDIFQVESGICDWKGRYALKMPDHSKNHPQGRFYKHDNLIDNDLSFRKESIHAFFVQHPQMFHLHLNTLDSGVKVRYSIMTHDHEIVYREENFAVSHQGFGMITPTHHPKEAM